MPTDQRVTATRGSTVTSTWSLGSSGMCSAVLKHAVNYHVDKVVDALEGFGLRFAPRRRPVPFEGWAIGMPAGRIPIEILISLHDDFEGVGFHENYFARLLSRMRETNLHLSGQAFAERIITVSH